MTKRFQRRFYRSFRSFWDDFRFLMGSRSRIRALMREGTLSPAFRERLMLAVTAVNGCRYCSYFHARQALTTGISDAEIQSLLNGVVADCPQEEALGVLYAQHWAEMEGKPDQAVRQRLVRAYGDARAAEIELALRMIRMGNLLGNTWDYLLYRVSGGRWGLTRRYAR